MIFFNKFNVLTLFFFVLLCFEALSMESADRKRKRPSDETATEVEKEALENDILDRNSSHIKRRREFLETEKYVGKGANGIITVASPMKNGAKAVRKFGVGPREGVLQERISGLLRLDVCGAQSLNFGCPDVEQSPKEGLKMLRAPGHMLSEVIHNLSPVSYLEICSRAMRLVQHMHDVGYAHEDLSLDNIMYDILSDRGTIIDFGNAGLIGIDKRNKSGAGGFFAPEMLKYGLVSPEADVFSLGKILERFFIAFGPYEDLKLLIQDMCIENPDIRISLPKAIEKLEEIIASKTLQENILEKALFLREAQEAETIAGYVTVNEGY